MYLDATCMYLKYREREREREREVEFLWPPKLRFSSKSSAFR